MVNKTLSGVKGPLKNIKTIVTIGQDAKFGAICAADVGIPMNGELVSEFAALQLPSVVISNMNIFYAYITQLYNNFYSDINYAIRGEAYHELVSTAANKYKLSDEIYELYADPKLRYHFAKRYSNVVHEMIPNSVSEQDTATIANLPSVQNVELNNKQFTYSTMASKVLKAAHAYE